MKSAGSLAFGPDGILFVGDSTAATVFAIDTGDASSSPAKASVNVKALDRKIASLLGTSAAELLINDVAVNPLTGRVFVSVARGRGPDAAAVILSVDADGTIKELSLKSVRYAEAKLPNPGNTTRRGGPITDLSFVQGRVLVAGLSNEEFASNLRSIPFPFRKVSGGSSIEIFHGAHGRFETRAPIRTFTHYSIGDEVHLLAAYTCTPLVKIPVKSLLSENKARGTTVAELGNRNRPLDIVVYKKNDRDYLLIANSARGVMKVSTEKIADIEPITTKISGTSGLTYETIESLQGVAQLDKLDDAHAVLLVEADGGFDLRTIEFP